MIKKTDKKLFVYKEFSNKNINYLNKHLFMFRKKDSKHCNFCKLQDETKQLIIYLWNVIIVKIYGVI